MESSMSQNATSSKPVPKWLDAETLSLRGSRRNDLRALVDWLNAHDQPQWPAAQCLLGRPAPLPDPVAGMRELVDQIVAELPKSSREPILALLGRAVVHRNEYEPLQLPLPAIPISLPKPVPPFTPDRWSGLARFRTWRNAFLEDIAGLSKPFVAGENSSKNASHGSRNLRMEAGRVLASAALCGGILCRRDLETLYLHLPHWPQAAEFSWGRMYLAWVDENGNCRRWQADAITAFLLLRLPPRELPELAASLAGCRMQQILAQYFRKVLRNSFDSPASPFEFLDSCLMHYELRLPPCVADYASGKQRSSSPDPETWARMVGGRPRPLLSSRMLEQSAAGAEDTDEDANLAPPTQSPGPIRNADWLSLLRESLTPRTAAPARALQTIKNRLEEPGVGSEERLFLDYAADTVRSGRGRRHRMKTLRERVIEVAKRLPAILDLNDPASLDPEALAGAYTAILDDAISESQCRKLRRYLRTWHQWLAETGRTQALDEAEVFGTSPGMDTIDARLVLEDEYIRARDSLLRPTMKFENDCTGVEELRHIAGLILILGYRCGTRKMEALKARLEDLLLDEPAEFLVRPWPERRLKSPNAIRKLPLRALLDPTELKNLADWKKRRLEQNQGARKPSLFLFCMPSLERAYVPEGRIFPVINSLLREVTGDPGTHFHILRKSGAGTWLAFALLRPSQAPLPGWLNQWKAQQRRLENSPTLQERLYSNGFLTRRHLYLIARTLGHGSTEVSAANYLELQGELLAMWLGTLAPKLSQNQIRGLASVSQATASGVVNKNLYQELWTIFGRRWKRLKIEIAGRIPVEVPPGSMTRSRDPGRRTGG